MRSIDSASGRKPCVNPAESSDSPGSLSHQPRRRRLQQRLPRSDIVREPGDCLQFLGFQSRIGNPRFGREFRGIEEPAQRNGHLLGKHQADFARQPMLPRDPVFVDGRAHGENRGPTDGRCGKTGDKGEQRLPLESGEVGILNRGRNGIEQRHAQQLSYGVYCADIADRAIEAGAEPYVEEAGVLGFEAESEDADVEADSDDADFDEESEAAGLLSPLLSVAGGALVSDELESEELAADLGA